MNPFFSIDGHWPEYPRRSFARLDQIEPDPDSDPAAIAFAFDAVDADWAGFTAGMIFDLNAPVRAARRAADFWHTRFDGRAPADPGPFEDLPMYRIEITLGRDHDLTPFLRLRDDDWVEIELGPHGFEVDVFGGLFAGAVTAHMPRPPRPSRHSELLSEVFDMVNWPDAAPDEILASLPITTLADQLIMFDIGQGAAFALVSYLGYPYIYFDLGCGVYRNAATCPAMVQFCDCASPPVILSHWDADHWAGARKAPDMLSRTWVAPRQRISASHAVFANDILAAGGQIRVVPTGAPPLIWQIGPQVFTLRRAVGSGRNGTGLVLIAENLAENASWLLVGDAGYSDAGHPPGNLSVVAVPHHGAAFPGAHAPPTPHARYRRALYSFGPGNAHGRTNVSHPRVSTVHDHHAAGWLAGTWMPPPPAMSQAGSKTLATSWHMATHLDGARAGWTAPPPAPAHMSRCRKAMPTPQT